MGVNVLISQTTATIIHSFMLHYLSFTNIHMDIHHTSIQHT